MYADLPFSVGTTMFRSITTAILRYYFCYEKRMLTKRGLLMKTFIYSIMETCYGWLELNCPCSISEHVYYWLWRQTRFTECCIFICIMQISDNNHPFKSTDLWKTKPSDNLPKLKSKVTPEIKGYYSHIIPSIVYS